MIPTESQLEAIWYRYGFDEGRGKGNPFSPPDERIRVKAYKRGFDDARKLG